MPRINLIQLRRDTAANWTSTNPVLAVGETGFETDTRLTKVGNGSSAWTSLPYVAIPNDSVTTAKIGDSQITGAKIANSEISTAKIGDSQITTAKFAPTASITFVGGKRIIVQTTEPTAPVGGFGVGDVWISY
jgi:hypothetical protein